MKSRKIVTQAYFRVKSAKKSEIAREE